MNPTRTAWALLLSLGLLAGAVPLTTSVRAADVDPLVTESLAALTTLVSGEVCVGRDAADDEITEDVELPYRFCDDGVVPTGGGSKGIPVPVKYASNASGDDFSGLPAPASVEETTEADATYDLQPEEANKITLDVDITLPPSSLKVPTGGRPVIALMHGCCGGNRTSWESATIDGAREHWHHNNAWWAARGYVVVNYTARGFRNGSDEGSTGSTQLDSRRFEVNDFQYLVGLLADHDKQSRAAGTAPIFKINPKKVGAVGGSYGGGWTWLALTDPTWKSPAYSIGMRIAAAVPKYGWTDLVEALVPSGHYLDRDLETGKTAIAPTTVEDAPSRNPIGVMKQSIVTGLYATGNNMNSNHTTFPAHLHSAMPRLQQGEPYDGDATMEALADNFLNDRSAYYQGRFWERVDKGLRVPTYVPATWTDPLFPPMESLRFYNKLKQLDPNYPVTMYFGDYQHFVANKAKEWGDLCGEDHHVCTADDYRRGGALGSLNKAPTRVRQGINSRINRFLDFYLLRKGTKPAANVSATTTICEANATDAIPADEPGLEYRASSWRALAPKRLELAWSAGGIAIATIAPKSADLHAQESDPVVRDQQDDKCHTTTQLDSGPGALRLISEPLEKSVTMLGLPALSVDLETAATDYWVAARMYDTDGTSATMVTRGLCKVNTAASDATCETFELFGNAWTFEAGHRIVIEISQSDTPFLRPANLAAPITIGESSIEIPLTKPGLLVDPRI